MLTIACVQNCGRLTINQDLVASLASSFIVDILAGTLECSFEKHRSCPKELKLVNPPLCASQFPWLATRLLFDKG